MTACELVEKSPILHVESTVMVSAVFCMSGFEHISWTTLPPVALISLSVSASMQCSAVCAGRLPPSNAILSSHSPGLRAGRSAAAAGAAKVRANAKDDSHRRIVISFSARAMNSPAGSARHCGQIKAVAEVPYFRVIARIFVRRRGNRKEYDYNLHLHIDYVTNI